MKALLLCKETFAPPMLYLARLLKDAGIDPALFFVYPEECMMPRCAYNEVTFYKVREQSSFPVYDVSDIALRFTEDCASPETDWLYLDRVQDEYTHFKPLNLQLVSSQPSSRSFHYRKKFSYTNADQNAFWLQLCYQKTEEVLDEFRPDCILDLDTGEMLRTVINEVAYKRTIPYVTLEYPRYEEYKIPTFSQGLEIDDFFRRAYEENEQLGDEELREELDYVRRFREQKNIMGKQYAGTITAAYKPRPLPDMLKHLCHSAQMCASIYRAERSLQVKGNLKESMISSSPWRAFGDVVSQELLRQYLFRRNKHFKQPVPREKYVYMPLHLIPESTTSVKSPYYVEELHTIKQISKSLPIGWMLYVKEHQSMLGERPLDFYAEVNRLPNAKMVALNYYEDPKPWIDNSVGVVTATGTSAYEAALLGKRSIVFGPVPFSLLPTVKECHSFEGLGQDLAALSEDVDIEKNDKSCAAYIKTVKDVGVSFDINRLLKGCYQAVENVEQPDDGLTDELLKLRDFYLKALEQA